MPRGSGGDGDGDGDGGGLAWLTNAAEGSVPATTVPTGFSSAVEVDLDSGNDWLAAAKSRDHTKPKPRIAASTGKATAAPAAPGGWMSSGKLGLSTEEDRDQDNAGTAGAGGSAASTTAGIKPRKRKQARGVEPVAGGPGAWISAGTLGVPTAAESDDDDEKDGDGGGGKVMLVTMETQTEGDIEAMTETGATERGGAPRLPPWAKPWVPPPKPQVVPDPAPEVTSAASGETKKKVI